MKISKLRKLVRQVISEAGTGGIAGHTGRKGQDIDDYTAGPFFPDNNVTSPLENQIKETQVKRSKIKPNPVQKWVKAHISLEPDDVPDYAGSQFANESEYYKEVDIDYRYDEAAPIHADSKTFVNDTPGFKIIGEGKVKSRLRNIIREVIREASGTQGGAGTAKKIQTKTANVDAAVKDVAKAKSKLAVKTRTYSGTKKTLTIKQDAADTATQAVTDHEGTEPTQFNKITYQQIPSDATHYIDGVPHNPEGFSKTAKSFQDGPRGTLGGFRDAIQKTIDDKLDKEAVKNATQTLSDFDTASNWLQAVQKNYISQRGKLVDSPKSLQINKLYSTSPRTLKDNQELIMLVQPGITELVAFNKWVQDTYGKGPKPNAIEQANRYVLWRRSLGPQGKDGPGKSPGVWFYNVKTGKGKKVDDSTRNETRPQWTTWNNTLTTLKSKKGAAEDEVTTAKDKNTTAYSGYKTASDILTTKQAALDKAREEQSRIEKDAGIRFKGATGTSTVGRARGRVSKGRAVKGKRSTRTGGVRGGTPSKASLSGMKSVKGKGGKGDEKKHTK